MVTLSDIFNINRYFYVIYDLNYIEIELKLK